MAASGKKNKTKWNKVPAETVIDQRKNPTHIALSSNSWEDEVSKELDVVNPLHLPRVELPTAPKASRGTYIDESKIPTTGPFQAYVSNIPYDLVEDELRDVFANLKIKSVRLAKEDKTAKAKGYGYVEFEDRSSLSAALSLGDTMLKGRPIKIDLPNSDMSRGGNRMRNNRDRDQGSSDRTTGNWRSGPRMDDFDDRSDRDRGYNRGYGEDRRREGGFGGGGGGGSGYSRGGFDREERGFSREERESSSGGGSGSWRDDQPRGGGFRDRDNRDRGGYEGGRFERDGGGRSFDRYDDRREPSRYGPPPMDRGGMGGESRNRPKLQLQPRSKPKEGGADSSTSSASIFGGAKPVDTAAREREIEERLMRSDEFPDSRSKGGPGSTGSGGGGREERRQWEPAEKRMEPVEKHVEPAPPPKENAWARKSQPIVNNGRSSPEDEGSRPNIDLHEEDSKSKRIGDDVSGVPNKSRGKESERHISKHRERKESIDDISKMPKVPETKTPNFAGSNKYSSLVDSDEATNE